jgi:hypothetical protein
MSEYEALDYFLGYFHQDWDLDYDHDPWGAVLDFARSDPETAVKLRTEIADILASGDSEAQIRALVDVSGVGYAPDRDGWTYRDWLAEVSRKTEEYLRMRGPYTCPVCGYIGLVSEPRTPSGDGSFEHCPSCEFIFGTTDHRKGYTYEQWRKRWIDRGLPWESGRLRPPPRDWDPYEQLRRLMDDGNRGEG